MRKNTVYCEGEPGYVPASEIRKHSNGQPYHLVAKGVAHWVRTGETLDPEEIPNPVAKPTRKAAAKKKTSLWRAKSVVKRKSVKKAR